MSFADLPSDILILVSNLLVPRDFNEWKQQLSLLSINQNLRQVFFPHLYKHVFMAEGLKSEEVLTNVELVATSDFASHLHIHVTLLPNDNTRMKWDLNFVLRPTLFPTSYRTLKHMVRILYDYPKLCSRITKLSVNTMKPRIFYHRVEEHMDYVEAKIAQCTRDLIKIMPDINDLTLCGEVLDGCTNILQENLAKRYAAQLSKLYLMQCDDYMTGRVYLSRLQFSQITNLKLKFHASSRYDLLQVSLQTIQRMDIENLQPKRTWNLFSRDTNGSVVVPHLRELKLHFINNKYGTEAAVPTMLERRLHFPRLQILELKGTATHFPLLNMAVLPDKMNKISITARASTFMSFSDVVLPAARELICKTIGEEPVDDLQFFSSFSWLMQNSPYCESTSVFINNSITHIYVDKFICPGLTSLELELEIDFDAMVIIIAKHPQLTSLSLNSVSAVPLGLNSNQPVTPLNTSIRKVCMVHLKKNCPDVKILKYLMLRLPALEYIYGQHVDRPKLQKFARKNSFKYPHLANIKFEFYGNWLHI